MFKKHLELPKNQFEIVSFKNLDDSQYILMKKLVFHHFYPFKTGCLSQVPGILPFLDFQQQL